MGIPIASTYLKDLYLTFNAITVYKGLLQDTVIQRLYVLVQCLSREDFDIHHALDLYSSFFYSLLSSGENGTASVKEYLLQKLLFDDNFFSRTCETVDFVSLNQELISAVQSDLFCLQHISSVSSNQIKEVLLKYCNGDDFKTKLVSSLPSWDSSDEKKIKKVFSEPILEKFYGHPSWTEFTQDLHEFYQRNGSGIFAQFKSFLWERIHGQGHLKGINDADPIRLKDLIGYEAERSEVISNTLQFLKGYHANNMLLYGDRGTGKSSTVKAVMNEYYSQGLRLIEVPKMYLSDFPEIIRLLRNRKQKFIIFVDDLVFEDNEENYTTLKAALEGGVEAKPENVLIYATSNRRHLIKEKFSDRLGLQSGNHDDEVRSADTIQEKLSLSDRFGITVVFSSPNKQQYLEIVEGLLLQRGLVFDKDTVAKEALRWELWYNGRSPRTARQFVDWLEGQDKLLKRVKSRE
ncbi:MAG: ATP-binding protein [Clostridia bacterium]|nr:ATP-binding protein [Clostridia bacterium]